MVSSKDKNTGSSQQGETATAVKLQITPSGGNSDLHLSLNQAVRDLRRVNGRDETNGTGAYGGDFASLLIANAIIDGLSGAVQSPAGSKYPSTYNQEQFDRWVNLFSKHGFDSDDVKYLHGLAESLSHGYGAPNEIDGRKVSVTSEDSGYAIDTSEDGQALISIPAYVAMVEAMVAEDHNDWDPSWTDDSAVII